MVKEVNFINKNMKLHLPVYLEPKTLSFVKSLAEKKKTNISKVVNDLIKTDMKLIEYAD